MTTKAKIAVLAAAIAVLVTAALVLPKGDTDTDTPPQSISATPTPPTGATGAEKPKQHRREKLPLLAAADPRELTFKRGDTVRFSARSEFADEVHVHGYDETMELPANRTKSISFKADIEGVFEVELEQSGTPIGTITVEPR